MLKLNQHRCPEEWEAHLDNTTKRQVLSFMSASLKTSFISDFACVLRFFRSSWSTKKTQQKMSKTSKQTRKTPTPALQIIWDFFNSCGHNQWDIFPTNLVLQRPGVLYAYKLDQLLPLFVFKHLRLISFWPSHHLPPHLQKGRMMQNTANHAFVPSNWKNFAGKSLLLHCVCSFRKLVIHTCFVSCQATCSQRKLAPFSLRGVSMRVHTKGHKIFWCGLYSRLNGLFGGGSNDPRKSSKFPLFSGAICKHVGPNQSGKGVLLLHVFNALSRVVGKFQILHCGCIWPSDVGTVGQFLCVLCSGKKHKNCGSCRTMQESSGVWESAGRVPKATALLWVSLCLHCQHHRSREKSERHRSVVEPQNALRHNEFHCAEARNHFILTTCDCICPWIRPVNERSNAFRFAILWTSLMGVRTQNGNNTPWLISPHFLWLRTSANFQQHLLSIEPVDSLRQTHTSRTHSVGKEQIKFEQCRCATLSKLQSSCSSACQNIFQKSKVSVQTHARENKR